MLSLISNNSNNTSAFEVECLTVEKKNIINIFKLVIKDLIEISFKNNKHVDKQSLHLIYFYDVFENILNHGYKGKKGFALSLVNRTKDLTALLDLISTKCDVNNCLASIKDMSDIKTPLGRIRAWIRLSIMQKKFAENFSCLLQEKAALTDLYDANSILVSEEGNIISGILVGLNALDIAVDLRSESAFLDQPIKSINYSIYLREKLPDSEDSSNDSENSFSEQRINEIFDQKNFLEEINKKLELKADQLNIKVQTLEKTNAQLTEKVSELKLENLEIKNQLEAGKLEKEKIESECKKKIESIYQDVKTERDTFNFSKSGLDQMYIELQRQYREETKIRSNLEVELETQTNIRNEKESALKLVETELNEKQEMYNILRDQLDQVKSINLDLVNEVQKLDSECKKKAKDLIDTQEQLKKMTDENADLKKNLTNCESTLRKKEEICNVRQEQIETYKTRLDEQDKDLAIERNWRVELQTELAEKQEQIKVLNEKLNYLNQLEQENKSLEEDRFNLNKKLEEAERTLEEMGSRLGTSQQKMEEVKQVTKQIHSMQWEPDENVKSCKICTKEFNLARRKHHCRRCGGIFCNECSDNKMALPSSSKPERVCNTCYEHLIQKSSIVN